MCVYVCMCICIYDITLNSIVGRCPASRFFFEMLF